MLLQVLVLPLTGAIADRTGRKREMLAGFAFVGALAARRRCSSSPTGATCSAPGCSSWPTSASARATVVYYSWLPDLASPDERDAVSSRGWAFGYLGGALLLAVNLALFTGCTSPSGLTEGEAVRICLASAGVWWAGSPSSACPGCATGRDRDDGPGAGAVAQQLPPAGRHAARHARRTR